MTRINIYLNFDGDCAKAFDLYEKVLGGKISMKTTFGESPMKNDMPDDYHDRIMHVSLPLDNMELMGCDTMPKMPNKKGHVVGTNVHVSLAPDSKTEADRLYKELTADGGSQDMPMKHQFWGAYYGMATDRFGVQWMINYSPAENGDKKNENGASSKRKVEDAEGTAIENGEEASNKKAKAQD